MATGAQETIKWTLTLVDIVTGPAKTSVLALAGLDRKYNESTQVLSRFEKTLHAVNVAMSAGSSVFGAASKGFGALGSSLSLVSSNLVEGARLLKDMAYDMGALALGAAAYREDTVVGMKALFQGMANGGELANELFDHAMRTAIKTKFETRDVIDIYNRALTAGIATSHLDTIAAAVSDVSTAFGQARGSRFMNAILKMQMSGRTTFGTLQQAGLAGGGVPYEEIAKELGLDTKKYLSKGDLSTAVRKELLKGVDASIGIKALLERTRTFFDPGGKLGDYAVKQSETLSGVYSNFKEAVTNLFMRRSFSEIEGIKNLKGTMITITKLFDPTQSGSAGKAAQKFQEVVNRIANDILSVFGIKETTTANKLFEILIAGAEGFERQLKKLTVWINETLKPAIADLFTGEVSLGDSMKNALIEFGRILGEGIAQGMAEGVKGGAKAVWDWTVGAPSLETQAFAEKASGWDAGFMAKITSAQKGRSEVPKIPSMQKTGEDAGKGLEQGIRLALDMHSPSRVMYNIGRDGIAAGLTQGTKAGVKDARRTDAFSGGAIVFSGPVTIAVQPPDGSDASVQRSLTEAMLRVVERASRSPGASMVQR